MLEHANRPNQPTTQPAYRPKSKNLHKLDIFQSNWMKLGMESQMCAVGGWGPMFGTKSQINTFFLTPFLNKDIFDALDDYCHGNYASLFPNSFFGCPLPGLKMFIRLAKNKVALNTARSLGVIIAWIAETKLSQHCCTA